MNWFVIGLLLYLGIGALLGLIFVGVLETIAYVFARAENKRPIAIPQFRLFFSVMVLWLPLFILDRAK